MSVDTCYYSPTKTQTTFHLKLKSNGFKSCPCLMDATTTLLLCLLHHTWVSAYFSVFFWGGEAFCYMQIIWRYVHMAEFLESLNITMVEFKFHRDQFAKEVTFWCYQPRKTNPALEIVWKLYHRLTQDL